MKKLFYLLFLALLSLQANSQCYELVWEENFDGTSINQANWNFQTGSWSGSQVQNCYTTNNTDVSGGTLQIEARYEPGSVCSGVTRDFTSGFIQTKNIIDWTFGRFEARIKMPASNSTWPAFWMSPQDKIYGDWPQSGEIDILEIKGHDMTKSYGNAIWGIEGMPINQDKQTYNFPPGNGADNWHVYAVEWNLGKFDYFIDGNYYGTIDNFDAPNATTHPGPFDDGFYLRLNMAVGGTYLDPPWNDANNAIAELPATMEVDWVRVYQDLGNCPPVECDLVENGGFDNGLNNWNLFEHNTANGNLSILGNGFTKIDIINPGTSSWHLALRQTGLALENGKTYYVRLTAYADASRSAPIIISKSDGTQYTYISQSLTTSPTIYEHQFTMNAATDLNGVFNLNVGNNLADVYVTNISISEVQVGTPCDDGNECTINDAYDNLCNCIGTFQDADNDGICTGFDPDDNDPCNPEICDIGNCELIDNWSFDNGLNNWTLFEHNSADGNLSIIGNEYAKIEIINPGTSSWHLALRQSGLPLENGKTYQIRLRAYADDPRNCSIIISKSDGSQYAYNSLSLTAIPSIYQYTFTMNAATDLNATFNLNVGNNFNNVYVSEISVSEIGCVDSSCPVFENLSGNTTANTTYNASQTISSDANIKADVIYKAGDCIELNDGFSVEQTKEFTGKIEDCDGN